MSFGMQSVRQTSWDARAAANFIAGGTGAGLVCFAAFAGNAQLPILAGLALVGIGLVCVWAEAGRPLRAMNVVLGARRSWMTREALVAPLLFAAGGIAALTGSSVMAWIAAALALAFMYCQARILRAAKGIPAWRDPLLTPFLVATALADGAGAFWLCALPLRHGTQPLLYALGALVVIRLFAWLVYRRSVAAAATQAAIGVLDRAGRVLQIFGTLIPIVLVSLVASGVAGSAATLPLAAIAGLCALVAGAWVKAALVLRAGFNQGFALPHLPVRGVRP